VNDPDTFTRKRLEDSGIVQGLPSLSYNTRLIQEESTQNHVTLSLTLSLTLTRWIQEESTQNHVPGDLQADPEERKTLTLTLTLTLTQADPEERKTLWSVYERQKRFLPLMHLTQDALVKEDWFRISCEVESKTRFRQWP